jgi:single-stranded-DNA-specific exonuclease
MTRPKQFLNVSRSARGMAWSARLPAPRDRVANALAQDHDVGPVLARILAARDVDTTTAAAFLEPSIRDLLPNPRSLTDMQKAGARLAKAIISGENVGIFGDYDVDGAASSALLKRYLGHFDIRSEIHIPDRVFEGYGPNTEAMVALAERGASLIVTVDCGTNSEEPIRAAQAAGADVIVLDHHQVGGPLPQATAVVNPNREDDLSGQGHLCAAGVVFLALVETNRHLRERGKTGQPDLMQMLDVVALATVCDVVPLVGVNRAFVRRGLEIARALNNPGIAALARVGRIGEPLNAYHFGFVIGPRINAGGRIGDAALGAKLLCCDDPVEAGTLAEHLDALNSERQKMEADMLAEAEAEAVAEFGNAPPAVVITAREGWHPGIVGLIAARLKERLRRPSVAISFDGAGRGTGSARSIPGFDIGRLVRDAVAAGVLVKGGGHAMAAGLTVERGNLGRWRDFAEAQASKTVEALAASETLEIDAAVSGEAVTVAFIEQLERAGPFGSGNPQPVLALPSHRLVDVMPVGRDHLRLSLRSQTGGTLAAIAFRAADNELGRFLHAQRGNVIHVAGTVSLNHWNGRVTPQFRVIDAALPER